MQQAEPTYIRRTHCKLIYDRREGIENGCDRLDRRVKPLYPMTYLPVSGFCRAPSGWGSKNSPICNWLLKKPRQPPTTHGYICFAVDEQVKDTQS